VKHIFSPPLWAPNSKNSTGQVFLTSNSKSLSGHLLGKKSSLSQGSVECGYLRLEPLVGSLDRNCPLPGPPDLPSLWLGFRHCLLPDLFTREISYTARLFCPLDTASQLLLTECPSRHRWDPLLGLVSSFSQSWPLSSHYGCKLEVKSSWHTQGGPTV
jgi:hypothetical protein